MQNPMMWQPSQQQIDNSQMTQFRHWINRRHQLQLADYHALYDWSVSEIALFWDALWDFCEPVAASKGGVIVEQADDMEKARFFPQAKLNFAQNLLARGHDEALAMIAMGEDGEDQYIRYAQLRAQVASLAGALKAWGVKRGDRVAGYLPNAPQAVIAMLATASLGAVWSSCSPDFGVQGVLDRFAQIQPTVLFVTDGYRYGGKVFDVMDKNRSIASQLPSLNKVVLAPFLHHDAALPAGDALWCLFDEVCHDDAEQHIDYVAVDFNAPLYVMFSSGTTGAPKCIVHGVGGTLLQHLKEHRLHLDLRSGQRIFYATTCGWMMWNWLVSALASGACLVLYDGSLFHPHPAAMFDHVERHGIHVMGVSAKYLDALRNEKLCPNKTHKLSSLTTMLSTGSPLAPETFDYVYASVKQGVCLSSISGGTDIISCFALGSNVLPVYRGELQGRGLGMAVEAWKAQNQPVINEKAELVCVKPFPSMPTGFWNDADGGKYHSAYFAQFEGVWCHGDFIEITRHGGVIIYGRSDAVLNPGGVRIGTAEIYRQVEQLDEIAESLVIGQQWNNDVRLVLFVRMADDHTLDDELKRKIQAHIRANTTPRHVPKIIIAVPDIPRTRSGKIVELAVRDVVHGKTIKNKEALINPEALEYFRDIPDLAL